MAQVLYFSSLCFGMGSLILFAVFLWTGQLGAISLKLTTEQSLLLDAGLSLLFFLQHSVMIRKRVRGGFSRLLPREYYGALYSLASGITLAAAMLLWQGTSPALARADGYAAFLIRSLYFIGCVVTLWGVRSLGRFDVFGVQEMKRFQLHKAHKEMPLAARGAYRWVRHPLYLSMLLIIWSHPVLTSDRLLFNTTWSIWILAATLMEERDLAADFGETYREYQKAVPMIVPWKIPK